MLLLLMPMKWRQKQMRDCCQLRSHPLRFHRQSWRYPRSCPCSTMMARPGTLWWVLVGLLMATVVEVVFEILEMMVVVVVAVFEGGLESEPVPRQVGAGSLRVFSIPPTSLVQ